MSELNPLLLDIPDQLQTERLLLRAVQPGDGPQMIEAVAESHAELIPWMPWAQTLPGLNELETFARKGRISWLERKELIFLGFQNERFVLTVGLQHIDWAVPKFEIGYWLRTASTGQGLMTEAVVAITNFAMDTLRSKRTEIRCDTKNEPSRRVAQRAGFPLESIVKNDGRRPDGTLRDTCLFALTREDAP